MPHETRYEVGLLNWQYWCAPKLDHLVVRASEQQRFYAIIVIAGMAVERAGGPVTKIDAPHRAVMTFQDHAISLGIVT